MAAPETPAPSLLVTLGSAAQTLQHPYGGLGHPNHSCGRPRLPRDTGTAPLRRTLAASRGLAARPSRECCGRRRGICSSAPPLLLRPSSCPARTQLVRRHRLSASFGQAQASAPNVSSSAWLAPGRAVRARLFQRRRRAPGRELDLRTVLQRSVRVCGAPAIRRILSFHPALSTPWAVRADRRAGPGRGGSKVTTGSTVDRRRLPTGIRLHPASGPAVRVRPVRATKLSCRGGPATAPPAAAGGHGAGPPPCDIPSESS
jgi:hypothetical protein